MPAYYASVAILLAQTWQFPGWGCVFLHLLFLPTFSRCQLNSVYWTLQVEEFFYWSLPIIHRLYRRFGPWIGLGILCTVSCGYLAFILVAVPMKWRAGLLSQTPFYLVAFGTGISSAVFWSRRREDPLHAWRLVALGGLGFVLVSHFAVVITQRTEWTIPLFNVALAPLFAAVVLGVARGGAKWLSATPMRCIGAISYSLYLWHLVIIRRVGVPFEGPFVLRLGWTAVLAIAVAAASFLVVERPFLQLRPRSVPKPRVNDPRVQPSLGDG